MSNSKTVIKDRTFIKDTRVILSPLNFHKVKNDSVSSITVKCPNNFALKTAIR